MGKLLLLSLTINLEGFQVIFFSLLESEKVGLKLNIQKTKIMASDPITSWQIDGKTMETVTDFILGGSKITGDDDCHHEIERLLLLGRKAMTNLDSILKSRDITLLTQVHILKDVVSFFISSVIFWLFRSVLFSFYMLEFFQDCWEKYQ